MIYSVILRTLLYAGVGGCMLIGACVAEILYGNGMSHPVWNRDYDWMPIITLITILSFVTALARTFTSTSHPSTPASTATPVTLKSPAKIAVSADLGQEHAVAIRGV